MRNSRKTWKAIGNSGSTPQAGLRSHAGCERPARRSAVASGSAEFRPMEFAPVSPPDADVAAAARARQDILTKPPGSLGRLEELSVWVAACQGRCPPRQFDRARVVVFAGDHGAARSGVSAYPAEVTAQMVANIAAGGADLLIPGDMGIGNSTAATALIAALTGAEPVEAVGYGTGIDDAGWMRKTATIRNALFRSRPESANPVGLLRCCGGADLAALAGFCAQAAVRRTPALLDGLAVTAAALVAERLAPGARQWWRAGHRSPEPAHVLALTALRLEPILDLRMRLGEGTGAAVALPVLRAAVAVLSSGSTLAEAGVSGPVREGRPAS